MRAAGVGRAGGGSTRVPQLSRVPIPRPPAQAMVLSSISSCSHARSSMNAAASTRAPSPALPPAPAPHLKAGLAGGGHGLAEGVEVDHDQVDGGDAVLVNGGHVVRHVAAGQDAAVHARVQRLHAACERRVGQRCVEEWLVVVEGAPLYARHVPR